MSPLAVKSILFGFPDSLFGRQGGFAVPVAISNDKRKPREKCQDTETDKHR